MLRTRQAHINLLPRLLTIALVGFVLYGITMSLVLTVADRWPTLTPIATWLKAPQTQLVSIGSLDSSMGKFAPWLSGRAFVLTAAYAFGLIAASGVALPSLYFYGLLAGVRLSMVDVLLHAVKAKAVAAVALIGILPIYVAVAMGVVIFNVPEYYLDLAIVLRLAFALCGRLCGEPRPCTKASRNWPLRATMPARAIVNASFAAWSFLGPPAIAPLCPS